MTNDRIVRERESRKRYNAELRLTALFQQCLRDLNLPLNYLHTEAGKETDFKRQQVGVHLREAFNFGMALGQEIQQQRDFDARWVEYKIKS
jgi:hypothetical protein